MKVLRYLVILSAALFVLSCAKDNQDIPQKKVTLTKLYTIEGFPEGADSVETFTVGYSLQIDKNGYLYILDEKSGSIKVFDNKGDFSSNISKRGMGPDELENGDTFYIHNDTVFVFDNRVKIKKFFKGGEYISTKVLAPELMFVPLSFSVLNDSTLIGRVNTYKRTDENVEISLELAIFDKEFNKIEVLAEPKIKYPTEFYKIESAHTLHSYNDEYIFTAQMSKSEYKIKMFSHRGEFKGNIVQNYAKKRYTESEMQRIKDFVPETSDHFDYYFDYKPAVFEISNDKKGRLWVQRSNGIYGSDIVYDIFENGDKTTEFIYKNDGSKEFEKSVYLKDRLYIVDHSNNLIEVYEYKIE